MRNARTLFAMIIGCAAGASAVTGAQAQVRDATYRGTLVCGTLPFAQDPERAAIEMKIVGGQGQYQRPVRMPNRNTIAGTETGTAAVDGDKIGLKGGWKSAKASYEATYGGTFVRRAAKLSGTQTWLHEGRTYQRECRGVIKRPLAAFLPKKKNAP